MFGIPALRIKGFYLALTTIAAQIIFPILIMALPEKLAGGAIGLQINPAKLGPLTFDTDISLYYLFMGIMAIMVYFAFNLVRTRVGRVFVAIRDNDIAAEIMGVNLFYYKTLAFFIGAFYAGVAGGLWAYHLRYVGADQFTIYMSIWFVGMIIVGGPGQHPGRHFRHDLSAHPAGIDHVCGAVAGQLLSQSRRRPDVVRQHEHRAGRRDHPVPDLRTARPGAPLEHRQDQLPGLAVPVPVGPGPRGGKAPDRRGQHLG